MHQRLYESDHHVDQSETVAPPIRRSRGQERLGNAAMLDKVGLNKTDKCEDTEPDLGPAEVAHAGATPAPPPPSADPITCLPSGDELVEPIRPPAAEMEAVRPEIAPACDYTRWGPMVSGGGENLDSGVEGMGLGELDLESMGMEMDVGNHNSMPTSKAVESMSDEEFVAYEKVTQDLVNNTIVNMSFDEKRSTLAEMGYPGGTIDQLNETEMNQALAGSLCKTFRGMRIQGMTPEEIDRLPPKEQRQFLTDLGVPAADLWRAPDGYIRRAVQDVVAVAKTPGHHTVKLKIRGGWFRGKSYDINMQVDDDGHLADVDIEKKGGLFSKMGGLIKKAMPYIAKMLAGVTGGLSLLALGIYEAIEAARSGDWLGAIKAAGGGLLAAGFDGIGSIIDKVSNIANSAVTGFQAIKNKNLGGIIEAFASGAESVASFAKNQLGGFATTAKDWADKARTWGGIAVTGVTALTAFKGGDALAAIGSSLDTVLAIRDQTQGDQMGPPTSKSNNPGVLVTSARLFGYAETARDAAKADPPQWGSFTANMFSMAGEYTDSGKVDTGRDLALFTQTFEDGVRSGDWSKAAQAGLDISKTIDLAHRGDISDEERDKVTGRYDKTESIVIPGMEAVEQIQTGNWAAALTSGLNSAMAAELARAKPEDQERIQQKYANADRYLTPSAGCAKALADGDWSKVTSYASQLGGELTENGLVDQGALFGQLGGEIWTKIESKDWRGAGNLAKELWGELQNLWGDAASDSKSIEAEPVMPPGSCPTTGAILGRQDSGPPGSQDALKRRLAEPRIELCNTGIQPLLKGEDPSTPLVDFGPATAQDKEVVLTEMLLIPVAGLKALGENGGTTVTVCHNNVTVAAPHLATGDPPRGWGERTFRDVPGVYLPGPDQAILCTNDGALAKNHGSDNMVVHELGHAIDKRVGGREDQEFIDARTADWKQLKPYERQINGGASETYAESMARFFGRNFDPRDCDAYPNLTEYWRKEQLKSDW